MPSITSTSTTTSRFFLAASLAALSAAAAACDPSQMGDVPLVFDACEPTTLVAAEGASTEEREALGAAIALWQSAGGPPLYLAGPTTENMRALKVSYEKAAPAFRGLFRPESSDIVLNTALEGPTARALTLAHEIGHAFGLPHVAGRPSLMNPGNLKYPPSAEDAQAIRDRRGACVIVDPVR